MHVAQVGRTMFETDRLPEGWAQRLNQMDEAHTTWTLSCTPHATPEPISPPGTHSASGAPFDLGVALPPQVWVPSRWAVDVFAAGGVDRHRLVQVHRETAWARGSLV